MPTTVRNWIARLTRSAENLANKRSRSRLTMRRALLAELLEERRVFTAAAEVSIEDINNVSAPLLAKTAVIGTNIYFADKDAAHGVELRKLDTLTNTLSLVADINQGPASSDAGRDYLFAVGDKLFFSAYDQTYGNEMRWIDTKQSTIEVHTIDVYSGNKSSINFENQVAPFLVLGTKVYFTATDNQLGQELRYVDASIDTTDFTTFNVLPNNYGSNPGANGVLFNVGNTVYFQTSIGDHSYALQYFDSTQAFPQMQYYDLGLGTDSVSPIEEYAVVGQKIFYRIDSIYGTELSWIDTSVAFSSPRTLDIDPTIIGSTPTGSNPSDFTVMGNRLFFIAEDQAEGREMRWIDTTQQVPTIHTLSTINGFVSGIAIRDPEIKNGIAAGSKFFFAASDDNTGTELRWIDFSLPNPTINTIDISNGRDSSNVGVLSSFALVGNKLYFVALDPVNGSELRYVDVNAANLSVKTIDYTPGPIGSNVEFSRTVTTVGNKLFFTARNDSADEELHWIDSTAAQPVVKTIDIDGGSSGSNPDNYLAVGSMLYYVGDEYVSGRQLRYFDTANNTTGTIKTPDGFFYAAPRNLTAVGDKVYFSALDASGLESIYWTSAQSNNQAVLVLSNQNGLTNIDNFFATNNRLFFTAIDQQHKNQLRWIDTQSATPTLHTLQSNTVPFFFFGSGRKNTFVFGDGRLYFVADDPTHGSELHWIDVNAPTPSDNFIDVNAGFEDSMSADAPMIYAQGFLYFVATDQYGYELRRISGTTSNPALETIDTTQYGQASYPARETGFATVGDLLFFSTTNSFDGTELSYIDLSPLQLVKTVTTLEFTPGSASTFPTSGAQFATIGSKLYFTANNPAGGTAINWLDTAGTFSTDAVGIFAGYDYLLKPVPLARGLKAIGNKLFFAAMDEDAGFEYHWIDSDENNPEVHTIDAETGPYSSITNTSPFSPKPDIVQIGSRLFFSGFSYGNGVERMTYDLNSLTPQVVLQQTSVEENIVQGDLVSMIDVQSANQSDVFTFTLVDGDGDVDNDSFTINGNTLIAAVNFDFETKSSYSIRIRAVDQNNNSYESALQLSVIDINEFAIGELIDKDASQNSISALAAAGSLVGITAFAQDLDGSHNSVRYSILSPTDGTFKIDPISGVVSVGNAGLVSQSQSFYSITIDAVSADNSHSSGTFLIQVSGQEVTPIAVADSYSVRVGLSLDAFDVQGRATVTLNDNGLLANDYDPQSMNFFANVVDYPLRGDLNLSPDGTFTYTPPADAVAGESVTFTYAIQNTAGKISPPATVTINFIERGVSPRYNTSVPTDVSPGASPGVTSPIDVLVIINLLNRYRGHSSIQLAQLTDDGYFYDVNNDYVVSSLDVLAVVNYINSRIRSIGEGESTKVESTALAANSAAAFDMSLLSYFPDHDDDEVDSIFGA